MSAKEIKKIIKEAERQGWRVEMRSKHYMAFPPDKSHGPVTLPVSPSDHRAVKNVLSEMRRRGFQWPPPRER